MAPPAACNKAKKAIPPNIFIRNLGFMKRLPIIMPAIAVDTTEANSKLITLRTGLSRQFLWPMSVVRTSKTVLAVVNPKKCVALGLSIRVIIVAVIPVMVTAPNFLIHHRASMSEIIPTVSHKNGMWVAFQKRGAM